MPDWLKWDQTDFLYVLEVEPTFDDEWGPQYTYVVDQAGLRLTLFVAEYEAHVSVDIQQIDSDARVVSFTMSGVARIERIRLRDVDELVFRPQLNAEPPSNLAHGFALRVRPHISVEIASSGDFRIQ